MNCSLAILVPTLMDKHNIKIHILPFWLVRRTDDLVTFICRLSRNSGSPNLLEP
jgi:hypothetical protein